MSDAVAPGSSEAPPDREVQAGIYLHWPFCERKCPYCDFYTFGREHPQFELNEKFVDALVDELHGAPARFGWEEPPRADTIYFGGGTPSLIGPRGLERVMRALEQIFRVEHRAEITLEVNPTTAEAVGLGEMLALGVNRISVGCQSFNDRLLRELGRVHDAATTRRALRYIRGAGARNLSMDIMFGTPTQTMEDFRHDVAALIDHQPEHISAYNLTIHEGTPYARWQRNGKLPLPDEDAQARMFEHLMDALAGAGYEHYEISNWCRPGLASRHNAKYWRDCDVFAFGPSAHGRYQGRRFENPRDLAEYMKVDSRRLAMAQEPPAGERARRGEIMMLALRRVGGVTWGEINAWAGADLWAYYRPELAQLHDDGLIEADDASIRLTRAGLLIADTVMEAFF